MKELCYCIDYSEKEWKKALALAEKFGFTWIDGDKINPRESHLFYKYQGSPILEFNLETKKMSITSWNQDNLYCAETIEELKKHLDNSEK